MITLPTANRKAFEKEIRANIVLYEALLIRELSVLLEELITEAVNKGSYTNRTGHLRSSIGGTVLQGGTPVTRKGFRKVSGTQVNEDKGKPAGEALLDKLSRRYKKGIVLIVVAGMKYAVYVETAHHKDVLTSSRNLMVSKIPLIRNRIKSVLEKRSK